MTQQNPNLVSMKNKFPHEINWASKGTSDNENKSVARGRYLFIVRGDVWATSFGQLQNRARPHVIPSKTLLGIVCTNLQAELLLNGHFQHT